MGFELVKTITIAGEGSVVVSSLCRLDGIKIYWVMASDFRNNVITVHWRGQPWTSTVVIVGWGR
jgi:hypothetical protein